MWQRADLKPLRGGLATAGLGRTDAEFAVQEVVAESAAVLEQPFSSSHVNQMFAALCKAGLLYKNRWGRYSFAVPLFDRFILRQASEGGP